MLEGHADRVTCMTHGNGQLFTGSADGTLRRWDLSRRAECAAVYRGHSAAVSSLAVDSRGVWMLSASRDSSMRLWHVRSGVCLAIVSIDRSSAHDAACALALDEATARVYAGTLARPAPSRVSACASFRS